MALWSKVQLGFDVDDETVNFATRIITENNGSLYETRTVATIESPEKVDQKPSVLASFQHSRLCVAIDKSITVFKNETCDQVLCNINFPSVITCYRISENGLFLFVVLTTGILYCLYLSDGEIIFTKSVPDNQNKVIEIFLKEQDEQTFIILVQNTGAIYRFSNVCLETLEIAFTHNDKSIIIEHTTNIQCSELFKGFTSVEFLNATVNALSEKLSVAMVGTNSLFTWPDEQHNNLSTCSFGYEKIKFLNNNSMLGLRTDNVLSVICSNTFLALRICENAVFDFTVIQHDNYCDILFLTESKHNRTMYALCLTSYPDFEQKLEINVSVNVHLFEALHAKSSNMFYVEGITAAENEVVDTFRIKTISESIPEMRLARLLRKRQYDAAEIFAKKLGLSMESIYCSKAALLVEQLGPWAKSTPDSVNVETLIDILDKIQDVQYINECCSKALISDYMQMKRIYLYARQRIMKSIKNGDVGSIPIDRLYTNLFFINDALNRLETFQMIQDVEVDNPLLDNDTTMKEWIRFSQTDLLEEFTNHLHMGQLRSATLIWTRHLSDMKHVSKENVRNFFITLPEGIAPSCLWPWLIHFIPTLSSLLPDAMNEIVSWGLRKLKYLEISHHTSWPEIGTDFAKEFVKLLKFEDNQQSAYFYQEHKCQNSALKQFMHLLQALSDIQRLKDNYKLRIPLDTYVDSPVETIYMLLDKIQLDEISNFLNTFLRRYMLNNNLQNDTVLCAYIQRIIKYSNNWWFAEEAAWEKRVVIIVGLICDIENQLEQILTILRKAPVPWSSTITTLAEMGSNSDHSLAFKIRIECDYVPIKLVLKKYGCTAIDVNSRLISFIIKENRDSMINDLDALTVNDQQLRQDAFCRCINVQLNKGNVQKAMDVVEHLENNIIDALYCYEGIINFIIAAISFRNMTTSLTYHIEMLGYVEFKIQNLLTRSHVCPFRCNNIIEMIKDLKSLYALKINYKINVTLKDYRMHKSLILHDYIKQILLPDIKENDLSMMHKKIVKFADVLGLERSYATLCFVRQTENMNVLQELVCNNDQNLDMTSDKFKDASKIYLSALGHAVKNTSVVEAIKNLSTSTLNTCKDSDLQSALVFHTCIGACPNLSIQRCSDVNPENTSQSWKLYKIYKDQTMSSDQLSLFRDVIFFYLHYLDQNSGNDVTCCNEEMSKLLNKFLERIKKNVQLQYNDYSLLQIFKTFYFMCHVTFMKDEAILTEIDSVLFQLSTNLLKKLCTRRSFDLHLGLSCLFMLTEQKACNWLSATCVSSQTDYNRHSIISTLGYEYARLARNSSLMRMFEGYKLLHIWAQRLSHHSIAYKEVLMNSISSKREILQQIVNNNKVNVIPLLKDYCHGFGFNFNDCLLLYLQVLLKMWKPTITVQNTNVNKELIISNDEVNELREKCNAIVAKLEDKSMLKRSISTLWEQITFYYYEVFLILMDLVEDKDTEKRDYLCFLQNYTRNGSSTSIELDEWIHLNPEQSSLPPIAQWRLPFLLKVDIWKIITPELNLKTYDKWLDIAPVLKLETHLVCTLAIKGEVTRVWENSMKFKNAAWSLYPKNTTLLRDIEECIQRMIDSSGFYYGTAALYYVVNHTPSGADRVAAAKKCYEYAQLAAQNSTKFEEGMLEKIRSKYLRFTAEHILRTHGLEKDNYLSLIENPHKLTYELYNDESIPLRYQIATNYKPDINTAVNDLSELFSLNMTKLRLDLLQEWLHFNVKHIELYQSFEETLPVLKEADQHRDHEDNLLRACYMLEYGDTNLFSQFLINIGFGNSHGETEYNYNVRYRALWVLQTVVDTATLEELTKQDIYTFRKYAKSLQYVSKLESLGLYYSINAFETCCKRELAQILWKNQRHLPFALCVIAQISIEFEIHDISLWDGILRQLTKLRMIKELKKILLQVWNKNVIVNCNGYKAGWQLIISEPFKEMDMDLNEVQINNCIEAIRLLYSCPVTHELDFTAIVTHCFQCEQAYLAAALLPFLNESEKKFVLEKINQTYQIGELVQNLNRLNSKGVLTVARSIAIVQNSVSQI